jgi:Spy/CpxP family protein refolding chaperone
MSPLFRNLAVTVLVALAAGAAGGWMGAERANGNLLSTQPLRQSVADVVRDGLDLTAEQSKAIHGIDDRFYQQRGLLRNRISEANMELADALMADMAYGRQAQSAVAHVQDGLGELQKATILYVLEVRDVLTPEQQRVYDRKVREALTAHP